MKKIQGVIIVTIFLVSLLIVINPVSAANCGIVINEINTGKTLTGWNSTIMVQRKTCRTGNFTGRMREDILDGIRSLRDSCWEVTVL